MTYEHILVDVSDGIAVVTLNRPKVLNALNAKTWEDLRAAFAQAQLDAEVRGVILTGAGDGRFSSRGDSYGRGREGVCGGGGHSGT